MLVKANADLFFEGGDDLREKSPFYQAIRRDRQWAIELMCDHGVDINKVSASGGESPLIYAAMNNYHNICLYLCLRTSDVDLEDPKTTKNVFLIYLERQDQERMQQVLTRHADINHVNRITKLTPLHVAIENRMKPSIIKFLLKLEANPHIEDFNGLDCCDKAAKIFDENGKPLYGKISQLAARRCKEHPQLRIKPQEILERFEKKINM